MRQNSFRDCLALNVSGFGGSLTRTNVSAVDRYDFLLPPLKEQKRIAEKLEVLLSDLDAAVQSLTTAL